MSRPRSLRSLYIGLAFVGVLALYWFSGLEDHNISHTFKQPEILVDHHGRGLKTKHSSEKSLNEITTNVKLKTNPVSKSTESPVKSQENDKSEVDESDQEPVMEVFKTKTKIEEKISKRQKMRALQNNLASRRQNVRNSRTKPSLFTLADYKPGKNSRPLKYGKNLTLTRLNMEFGDEEEESKANIASNIYPAFNKGKANTMDIVGNIKIGQIVPPHSAKHILVLTTWRSGSTFLGDLLNHYRGSFYYFEPLHYYSKAKNNKNSPNPVQSETEFLKSLMQCNFTAENIGFLHHASKSDNKFLFKNHNFRLWNTCHNLLPNDMMCFMPEYLNTVCPLFPIKLIKTVRLQMRLIEELITDSSLGLKVIFLVRDPRGTYNSRSEGTISKWCVHDTCANPAVGCSDMLDNIEMAFNLETRFPQTIKLVRYEDLSMFPEDVTMDLLDFLDLPLTDKISEYIATHTHSDKKKIIRNKKTKKLEHKANPYGTARNSTATAFAWREKLSFENIRKIQSACKEPMKRLGYVLYDTEEDVGKPQLPIENDMDKIWPFSSS